MQPIERLLLRTGECAYLIDASLRVAYANQIKQKSRYLFISGSDLAIYCTLCTRATVKQKRTLFAIALRKIPRVVVVARFACGANFKL